MFFRFLLNTERKFKQFKRKFLKTFKKIFFNYQDSLKKLKKSNFFFFFFFFSGYHHMIDHKEPRGQFSSSLFYLIYMTSQTGNLLHTSSPAPILNFNLVKFTNHKFQNQMRRHTSTQVSISVYWFIIGRMVSILLYSTRSDLFPTNIKGSLK